MKKLIKFTALIIALLGAANVAAQPLQADGGNSQTICEGQTANLGGSPSAQFGTPPYTYSWMPAGDVSNPTDPNPTTTPAVTTTFTLSVTDAVSTVATATLTIGVNPAPTVDPVSDITVCNSFSVTVPAFSGSVAGAIYTWTNSDPGIGLAASGTGDIPSFTAVNSGPSAVTAVISVTATNSGTGCTGPAEVFSIIVSPSPNATFSYSSGSFCSMDPNPSPVYLTGGSPGIFSATTGLTFISTATGQIDLAATTPGTYTITNTSINNGGCSAAVESYTVSVNASPTVDAGSSRFVCLGTSINFAASAGGTISSYLWTFDDGGTTTVANPTYTYLAAGTYHVSLQVVSSAGCAAIDTAMIYIYGLPVINTIGSTGPVCSGACTGVAYADVSGGSAPYSYTWTGVGINNDTITGLCSGSYTLSVMDGNMCTASGSTSIVLNTNTNIQGAVTYSGGTLASGTNTAVLFKYMPSYMSFDTIQAVTIDASGNYTFTSVSADDYLVKIFPDGASYPLLVPTYFGDEYMWDSSTVITHGCISISQADIFMMEGLAAGGPGMLSGNISQGDGFVRAPGDPVPGIDVKLGRNPGGQMVAQTETDGSGNFSFSGVAINSSDYYTIYVDIPGMGRDSLYNITVTATDNIFPSLDHEVDSNSVYPIYPVSVSVKTPGLAADTELSVYPNPSGASTTISYVLKADANVKLDVYDVLGKKVESLLNANQPNGTYKVNLAKLKAGVYFIMLNINNNNSNTTRLVVID